MNPIVIIPARMASTRLPGKPLAEIAGTPMIVRVWAQAVKADIGPVVVAAGDEIIRNAVLRAGGHAVLTDPSLPSGSDRIHAALAEFDPERRHDSVVNLQGDLPAVPPAAVQLAARTLAASGADIATLAAPIPDDESALSPHVVKAVVAWGQNGERGEALYFSRAPVPAGPGPRFHHVGIYAYTRAALARFVALPPSPLERQESLEQLRAMEAGMRIVVARIDAVPLSVDTPEDLELARRLLG